MYRLIDADELMHNLLTAIEVGKRNNEPTDELVAVLNYVDCNAEKSYFVPVVHGHWRRGKSYPHNIYCSNCYRTYVPNDEIEMWKDQTRLPRKYCPHCGAKMDRVLEEGNAPDKTNNITGR